MPITRRDINSSIARDSALALRVRNLYRNERHFRRRNGDQPLQITDDYAHRNDGGADIVCWNGRIGEVWVWEFKPDNAYGRRQGPVNLAKHLAQVESDERAAGKKVIPGPSSVFDPGTDRGVHIGSPQSVVEVRSLRDGIEIYQVHRYENRGDVPAEYRAAAEESYDIMEHFQDQEEAYQESRAVSR